MIMKRIFSLRDLTLCGLFAAVLAVCTWISIPWVIPFTMQTFAVFLTLLLLGGKRGTVAITLYLLLGAVGLPVFSGFRGGLAALTGPTGGYLWGFLLTALCYWALKSKPLLGLILGHLACYAAGTAWYAYLYHVPMWSAASSCVLPFLLPDGCKLALALFLRRRLQHLIGE